MLCYYEMHDLHYIFCGIRAFPGDPINREILAAVMVVLRNWYKCNDYNQFRTAIQSIPKYEERYGMAKNLNVYSYFPLSFIKDERIYLLLLKVCEQLMDAINEQNEEKVYDLADCIHNLPIYICDNKYAIPNDFWKNEVRSYRHKWEKSFLVIEQKMFQARPQSAKRWGCKR